MKTKSLRKLIIAIIVCMCISFAFCMVGCNKETDKNPDTDTTPETDIIFRVENTNETILLGNEKQLSVIASGLDTAPEYKSAAENIATVSNTGVVEGINEGQTTITVTYGEDSKTITINVITDGMEPVFNFNQILTDTISLSVNSPIDFSGYVFFNSKKFTDFTCTYDIADESIGKMDAINKNTFVPVKSGNTTIKVKVDWRGFDNPAMTKEFNVVVTDTVELFVNDGSTTTLELYTVNELQGKTYPTTMDFKINAKVNGKESEAVGQMIEGAEVISYADNKITAIKYGTAKIKISCKLSNGEDFEKIIDVNVARPVAKYDGEVIVLDASVGQLPVAEIFGKETVIEKATSGEENITVENGKLTGLTVESKAPEAKSMVVYDSTVGYEIQVKTYSKLISKAEDLACFDLNKSDIISGYYILMNDIDASAYTQVDHGSRVYKYGLNSETVGFSGILDGNGHKIDGITLSRGGLVGRIIKQGRIINLAMTNVHYQKDASTGAFACDVISESYGEKSPATFENIYFMTNEIPEGKSSGGIISATFVNRISARTKLKNCIIEVNAISNTNGSFTSGTNDYERGEWYKNVYVISKTPLLIKGQDVQDAVNVEPNTTKTFSIRRYENFAKMNNDKANNYDSFAPEFWDMTNNFPVWHGETCPDLVLKELTINGVLKNEHQVEFNPKTPETVEDITISVSFNGVEQKNVQFVFTKGEELVSVKGNVIKPVNFGDVELTVKVEGFERNIKILITPSIDTYEKDIIMDASAGTLPLDEIFNKQGAQLELAKDLTNKDDLIVAENKITGFKIDNIEKPKQRTLMLKTTADDYIFVKVTVYSAIITAKEDLNIFNLKNGTSFVDGYYILANNIDATGFKLLDHERHIYHDGLTGKNSGFRGTFDGQGFTIDGLTVGQGGLFGRILDTGTVMNLAMTNVHYDTNAETTKAAICGHMSTNQREKLGLGASLLNLYIQTNEMPEGKYKYADCASTPIIGSAFWDTYIENCIFEVNATSTTSGSFIGNGKTLGKPHLYKNVFMISPTPLHIKKGVVRDARNVTPDKANFNFDRYNTVEEMVKANNDYSKFSAEFWTVTEGQIPVWKTAPAKA